MFDSNEEWLGQDDDQSLMRGTDDFYMEEERSSHVSILRNSDYNLNSPLIRDNCDMMKEWLIRNRTPLRLQGNRRMTEEYIALHWLTRQMDIENIVLGPDASKIILLELRQYLMSPCAESLEVIKELGMFFESVKEMETIVHGFLKRRGVNISYTKVMSLISSINYSERDGRYFTNIYAAYLFLHIAILFMNALDDEETTNMARDLPVLKLLQDEKKEQVIGCLVNARPIKNWIFTRQFCFSRKGKFLIDKNHVLMLKDIFLSRFNSLFVLMTDFRWKYQKTFFSKMVDLYMCGDSLLEEFGDEGYDAVKLLEPLLVESLVIEAEEFRPRIPKLGEYSDFLREKEREMFGKFGRKVVTWFNVLKDISLNKHEKIFIYGCYRHWGHPYIDYVAGLNKLHKQVTMEKQIDHDYTTKLASDLAYRILRWAFNKFSRWFLDANEMSRDHPLRTFVVDQVWPPFSVIERVGDSWHLLPITQVFNIPESMDPSEILDDKSHSITRQELKSHLQRNPNLPVSSKKVIVTALASPPINPKEFIGSISNKGLDQNDLIIGLKAKERELKREGRFFALMSWNLRLYFVITEKLLSDHILPLFDSLTMTDNLNKVFKKLIDRVKGQGLDDYSRVTWAFHLDYEKWNNHQRMESTYDVFRVLDLVFGTKSVFTRTHEFFENSWIYYPDRCDQVSIVGEIIQPRSSTNHIRACWNGQKGGLEGLRQKGWSLISLLMISRESESRNTDTKILAQGDNQVMCPTYQLSRGLKEEDLDIELSNISRNANAIFENVKRGALKLGLIIKGEETMCSYDFLIYGKTPLFRGNILVPESKRWSRVSCLSNDQVVNVSNVMSTVSTNALTVAQHSQSLRKCLLDFLIMAVQAVYHYLIFSPILKRRINEVLDAEPGLKKTIMSRIIFLDPSLGGVSGTSLGRFHLRQFPDPVTEGLSFWKEVFDNHEEKWIRRLSTEAGYPEVRPFSVENFSKLIEDPTCLNLVGSASPSIILRDSIREALYLECNSIRNTEFREAILLSRMYKGGFLLFLRSIKPLFPRFLSEMFSASFLGISESIVGLIQNSRTIRRQFKKNFNVTIGERFQKSEESAMKRLTKPPKNLEIGWECSASRADDLRTQSWGERLVGTTVPHPSEMMRTVPSDAVSCMCSMMSSEEQERISVIVLSDLDKDYQKRGPLKGYLGSSTSSTTQIFHSWEKISNVHVVKRALSLRESINWFVKEGSNLAENIRKNMISLLGSQFPQLQISDFQRTGSALHRFHSSRYSEGGFSSISPNLLSYLSVSTDTLSFLTGSGDNYDFMFQPLMLYCQTWTVENIDQRGVYIGETLHWHIDCRSCIRPIEEVELETPYQFEFPNIVQKVSNMVPGVTFETARLEDLQFVLGDFEKLSETQKSYCIGCAQSILFSILVLTHDSDENDPSLFPVNVFKKVSPLSYLCGIARGLLIGGSLGFLTRISKMNYKRPFELYSGVIYLLIEKLKSHPSLYLMMKVSHFHQILMAVPHKIPCSYPLNMKEGNHIVVNYITYLLRSHRDRIWNDPETQNLWLFSDFRTPKISHLVALAYQTFSVMKTVESTLNSKTLQHLKNLASIMRHSLSEGLLSSGLKFEDEQRITRRLTRSIKWVKSEVRHAARTISSPSSVGLDEDLKVLKFEREYIYPYEMIELYLVPETFEELEEQEKMSMSLQKMDPLISGLRVVQMATGAHYKLKGILETFLREPDFVMVLGDGSGGISSAVLRRFKRTKLLFNSLLMLSDDMAPGSVPSAPSAILHLPRQDRDRVLNLGQEWERSTDLSLWKTWDQYLQICSEEGIYPNLIICDAEVTDIESMNRIIENMSSFIERLSPFEITVVIKSYVTQMLDPEYSLFEDIGRLFENVSAYLSSVRSSFTSEVYIRFTSRLNVPREKKVLSLISLLELSKVSSNSSTVEREFNRSQSIEFSHMIMGFPAEIIPNPFSEMIETLIGEGFDSSIVTRLIDNLEKSQNLEDLVQWCLAILVLNSNQYINVTKPLGDKMMVPESNPRLTSHYNMSLGILIFLSWMWRDVELYRELHELFNRRIIYYYSVSRYKKEKFPRWSWHHQTNVSKTVPINSDVSRASHWIRMLFKVFQDKKSREKTISTKSFDRKIKTFNWSMSARVIYSRTSLFDLIWTRFIE
ncbi:RNA-dependent RNA polymerase [Boana pugnax lyssa-like virus 1]|uniref:Replicase n=1 Tax=Boana pugnax lyssa-like virus 1 TaxID=2985438 RepID=A0AAE9T7R2_9RHAB|nr:RNA-dependent RNA polymerase [Boana pugnax lyssa-like virus 1]